MIQRVMCCIGFALALVICVPALSHAQGMPTDGYVDDYIVHVKTNCHPQWDNMVKQLVALNHKNGGDTWIALQSTYGQGDIFRFAAPRANYADIETGQGKMMMALQKSLGEAGVDKLFASLGACADSTQGVLRRRRWDLSISAPADAAAQAKVIGNARWERLIEVHVRPGMGGRYEAIRKQVKDATEKSDPNPPSSWVSQSVAGDLGSVYYIAQLRPTLGSFDGGKTMREMMGDSAFEAYEKEVSEVVTRTDVTIYTFVPGLSNPPDEVVALAPAYWRPKPAPPPKASPATPPAKN